MATGRTRSIAALTVLLSVYGGSAAAQTIGDRLAALRDRLYDPATTFSIRATLAELDRAEPETVPDTAERGRVEQLRGFVLWKAERFPEAIAHDEAALKIDAKRRFLTAHERVSVAYRIAVMGKDAGDYGPAADAYRRAIAFAAADPSVTANENLGMAQDEGYCLHEAGRFAEARRTNEATLAEAARVFGPDDIRLASLLTNLAQNQYELKDLDAARATLERLLAVATRADNAKHVDTALFQLGVLAFETGHVDEARQRMTRRVELARAAHDPGRLVKAQDDLDVLERKVAGGRR